MRIIISREIYRDKLEIAIDLYKLTTAKLLTRICGANPEDKQVLPWPPLHHGIDDIAPRIGVVVLIGKKVGLLLLDHRGDGIHPC